MPRVFDNGSEILSSPDNTRRIHILVLDSAGYDVFKDIFLMNFDLDIVSDFSIGKSLEHGFIYSSFGANPLYISVSGVYHHNTDLSDPGNSTIYRSSIEDPEDLFNSKCITSSNRELFTISTNYNGNSGSTYRGYMVKFKKNPMGQDKLNGYNFVITFVCTRNNTNDD